MEGQMSSPNETPEQAAEPAPTGYHPLYSEEFYLYSFKIVPCSKVAPHNWSVCPFVHAGEKARRRDPRIHSYQALPCPYDRKGTNCPFGDACTYTHNVYEYFLHFDRFRTQMCKDGLACSRPLCFFAHSLRELRYSPTVHSQQQAQQQRLLQQASACPSGSNAYSSNSSILQEHFQAAAAAAAAAASGESNVRQTLDSFRQQHEAAAAAAGVAVPCGTTLVPLLQVRPGMMQLPMGYGGVLGFGGLQGQLGGSEQGMMGSGANAATQWAHIAAENQQQQQQQQQQLAQLHSQQLAQLQQQQQQQLHMYQQLQQQQLSMGSFSNDFNADMPTSSAHHNPGASAAAGPLQSHTVLASSSSMQQQQQYAADEAATAAAAASEQQQQQNQQLLTLLLRQQQQLQGSAAAFIPPGGAGVVELARHNSTGLNPTISSHSHSFHAQGPFSGSTNPAVLSGSTASLSSPAPVTAMMSASSGSCLFSPSPNHSMLGSLPGAIRKGALAAGGSSSGSAFVVTSTNNACSRRGEAVYGDAAYGSGSNGGGNGSTGGGDGSSRSGQQAGLGGTRDAGSGAFEVGSGSLLSGLHERLAQLSVSGSSGRVQDL